MFCPNCGTVIPDDSKFCPICGANMSDVTPPPVEQHTTVEQPQAPAQPEQNSQQQQAQPYNQYNGYQQQQQGFYGYDQGYNGQYNNNQQPAQQQQKPVAPPKEKKPVDWKAFYQNYFYTLYVLIGVGAFLCGQLEQAFVAGNAFFFVLFTIFVFPLMLAFLALGIIRFVVGIKTRKNQENPSKEKARDIMIFGLSIIIFVFLFITTIVTLALRAELF